MTPEDDITERRRAEESLRESQDRFRSAFEHAAIGMALVRPDGRLLQVNPSFSQMLGYSGQELTSTTWQAITHPDDLAIGHDHMRRMLARKMDSCQFEKRYLHKLGHEVWALLSFSLVRDAHGSPLYFISQIQDIIARRRAEEALRESEERFRSVFESAPIAMAIGNAEGRPIQINRACQEMLGYSQREMASMVYPDFTHPDDVEESVRLIGELLEGKRDQFRIEKRYYRKDGHLVWASTVISALRDASGENQYVAMIQDITERKRAEEALRDSEALHRQLVELSPDAVVVYQEGRIVFANSGTAKLLRVATPQELVGRPVIDIVHPDYRGIAEERMRRLQQEGAQLPRVEQRFVRADGTSVDVEVSSSSLHYKGRLSVQVIARDITERKRMEEHLQRTRDELEGKVEHQLLRRNPYGLTFRELTVLHLVAAGESDKQIGITLGISHLTSQKHLSNILAKMDAASRTEAAARAIREGLLE